jgi:hypothetical protein
VAYKQFSQGLNRTGPEVVGLGREKGRVGFLLVSTKSGQQASTNYPRSLCLAPKPLAPVKPRVLSPSPFRLLSLSLRFSPRKPLAQCLGFSGQTTAAPMDIDSDPVATSKPTQMDLEEQVRCRRRLPAPRFMISPFLNLGF